MSTENIDLAEIKDFLVEIAQTAGRIIKEKSGHVTFDDKKNGKGICVHCSCLGSRLLTLFISRGLGD